LWNSWLSSYLTFLGNIHKCQKRPHGVITNRKLIKDRMLWQKPNTDPQYTTQQTNTWVTRIPQMTDGVLRKG
jgi:hypothetical protein